MEGHMCNHTNTNEQLLCASLQMMSDPVKEGCQLRSSKLKSELDLCSGCCKLN